MATLTATNPAWNRSTTRTVMDTDEQLIDGDATYKCGQFLRRASDGLVYEGTTSAASGVDDDAITHYALQDVDSAIGNDTTRKLLGVVHPDDLWEINELNGAVTEASKGIQHGMNVTSNLCTLDVDITTHNVFVIVEPVWRERQFQDVAADTLARLIVRVLPAAINAAPSN